MSGYLTITSNQETANSFKRARNIKTTDVIIRKKDVSISQLPI